MNASNTPKNRASVTATDVARRAGVSQSTVSRVFNKNWTGPLREDSKQRVLQAAADLGYTPNAIAHILNSKRSNIIGVVVSMHFDNFYAEVLSILTNILDEFGLRTMVFSCAPTQNINELLNHIMQYQVDGVIVTSSALSHSIDEKWISSGVPVVLYNGYLPGMRISAVHSDNVGGCLLMADYLVALGHRKFAYFTTGAGLYTSYKPREETFLQGLRSHGIDDCIIWPADYYYPQALAAARKFFDENEVPDAIFCSGDLNALAVIDVARERGLEVGKDVSIAGFYAPYVDMLSYQLTSLKQNIEQLAQDAVQILVSNIENPLQPTQIITRPMELVIGATTSPCPQEFLDRLQRLQSH